MHCPSRDDQKVKGECPRLRFNDTCLGVDADDFGHEDGCVFLAPQNMPDRPGDVGGRERSSCYLVKQWLKTMIVVPINNRDLDWCASQGFGCLKSAEARAKYYDLRVQLRHGDTLPLAAISRTDRPVIISLTSCLHAEE